MTYDDVVDDIKKLPHYREWICRQCGYHQKAYRLLIYEECERCGSRGKFRAFGSGAEIEDVISEVLMWLGKGDDFDRAMEWKRTMELSQAERDAEEPD